MAIRIAVDAMGGDDAPSVVLEGAVRAAQEAGDRIEVVLFGPEATLREGLGALGDAGRMLHLVDAPEVIGMGESPVAAVKSKPHSSIHLGLKAVKQGRAQAFVSAGNTGAVMAASLFVLGRLPGVTRPSLMGYFPTVRGLALVLDVGSNVDCKPEHLVQFALMGTVYAQRIFHIEAPVVGLLNIGEEPGKGNELVKEAFDLLEQAPGLHFKGNIEGRDVMHHTADVIVCDGFVGNVMLKFGESMTTGFMQMVRDEMQHQQLDAAQSQVVKQILSGVRERFNPDIYGGAPLLGVSGNVRIGHGSASPRAIEQMILAAANAYEQRLTRSVAAAFEV